MAVQIDCMIENLRDLVRVAADLGIVLAFENHMDYRISEIVPVVQGVASPWLRNQLRLLQQPVGRRGSS